MAPTGSVAWQLYVGVFAGTGIVCLLAIPRARQFEDTAVRRGLVWLLAAAGGWALFKALFFVVPLPFREYAYIAGLTVGFGTVWAWLYFCSAYTGRDYHRDRSLLRLGAATFLAVVAVKATNPLHGAYFTTARATTPFPHLAIQHGVLHWAAAGLSYALSAVGLFMIFQRYRESGYDTRPLSALTGLLVLPVVLDVGSQLLPWLIEFIYAPVGVAAFAVGVLFVFERRFVAAQQLTSADDPAVYLDERRRIRDYTPAAAEAFPELAGATGERLSAVAPAVADALDGDDRILERGSPDDRRYYLASESSVTLGDAGARLVRLVDVTETERQRRELVDRERALDEQNELYRAVIDASFAFVVRADTEGNLTFVSESVEDVLGYSPDELEGRPFTVALPDGETAERAAAEIDRIRDGESSRVRNLPIETAAGETVYTDVRGVPIYDGRVPPAERTAADVVGIQLMVRDATGRREREGLISVINRVLRHNLRNKMTVVTNYAAMLRADLDGERAERAAHIEAAGERLLDLSESAKKIADNRDRSPELRPLDVVAMVEAAAAELRAGYPAASVTVDAPEAAVAETNERFETALWELVENAAEHGGDAPAVAVEVSVDDGWVTVAVADDGPGLPEIEREVLLSDEETQLLHGEGLGLWLVYWIVTSLDGDLDADVSSAGTTVTVRLPRAETDRDSGS